MESVIDVIRRDRLMILSRGVRKDVLVKAVSAIADAGITLYESTFDHTVSDPLAENAEKIAALVKAVGDRVRIGAGTVLTVEEVRVAAESGAEYVISPGTDEDVIAETKRLGLVSIPGVMTPSEIMRALKLGADMVKLFPADDLGYHFIRNLKGPFPRVEFLATGGVNPETIPEFLAAGITAVGTGVTVMRRDLIEKEDYRGIAELARKHVEAVKGFVK